MGTKDSLKGFEIGYLLAAQCSVRGLKNKQPSEIFAAIPR